MLCLASMEELIKLAEEIKDDELKKKVIEILKDPRLTSKHFEKYEKEDIKKIRVPFSIGNLTVEREVYYHTIALTKMCIRTCEVMEEVFGLKLNKDYLIAASLLHDLMKCFEWKVEEGEVKHSGILLDHTMLGVAELYKRNFPEGVIHIIASHFGESGPTPPRNFEALIFHHLDNMLASVEFRLSEPKANQPILIIDEETYERLKND